jgi:hypothetical protein
MEKKQKLIPIPKSRLAPSPSKPKTPVFQAVATFGAFWVEPQEHQTQTAFVVLLQNKHGGWLIDTCMSVFWEGLQPLLPAWWFRYLELTGNPPTLELLRRPNPSMFEELRTLEATVTQPVKELHKIYYPARFAVYYQQNHPSWRSMPLPGTLPDALQYYLMRFRAVRNQLTAQTQRSLVQFRNYAVQHLEVYTDPCLQAAIGLIFEGESQKKVQHLPEQLIRSGALTFPEFTPAYLEHLPGKSGQVREERQRHCPMIYGGQP